MTKDEKLAQTMVCPHCHEGVTGTDYTGEAMECFSCDGRGNITIAFVDDQVRARNDQAGDLCVAHHLLQEVLIRWNRIPEDLREQVESFVNPPNLESASITSEETQL